MTTDEHGCEAVVLTIVCTDDDLRSFCRNVAGAVASTEWQLTRAFAVARQVHPQHPDALGTLATLMHCEFRRESPNDGEAADHHLDTLRQRLSGFETFGLQRTPLHHDSMQPLLRS